MLLGATSDWDPAKCLEKNAFTEVYRVELDGAVLAAKRLKLPLEGLCSQEPCSKVPCSEEQVRWTMAAHLWFGRHPCVT